jgi:hypothetical protein
MKQALAQRMARAQPQLVGAMGTPPPILGINANDAIYTVQDNQNPFLQALYMVNLIPGEFGVRIRPGTREFATNIPDADGQMREVRSVMYYNSISALGSGGLDHIIAATNHGLYDITNGGAGPHVPILIWPTERGNSGFCVSTNFTGVGGAHYLLIFDEANGYYIFDGNTLRRPSGFQPSDPIPANIVSGVEWQGRMWFVERNSASAWYTKTAGGIEGDIVELNMGSRFFKGGHLVQLAVWTIDDGAGMDDKLVAVSSAGDVVVWELSGSFNPDNPEDLRVVGRWYAGTVPEGRKVLSRNGGDILIMTSRGILRLADLLKGSSDEQGKHITDKINRYYRQAMAQNIDNYGWSMEIDPKNNIQIVSCPPTKIDTEADASALQFVYNNATQGWTMFRGIDMLCQYSGPRDLYIGTRDGRVILLDGDLDNVALDGSGGDAIAFTLFTHYSGMGSPGEWKRCAFIRPIFISRVEPSYTVKIRWDFDISVTDYSPPFVGSPVAQWDVQRWDDASWYGAPGPFIDTIGNDGMGRHAAIFLTGSVGGGMLVAGFDLLMDKGGLL